MGKLRFMSRQHGPKFLAFHQDARQPHPLKAGLPWAQKDKLEEAKRPNISWGLYLIYHSTANRNNVVDECVGLL